MKLKLLETTGRKKERGKAKWAENAARRVRKVKQRKASPLPTPSINYSPLSTLAISRWRAQVKLTSQPAASSNFTKVQVKAKRERGPKIHYQTWQILFLCTERIISFSCASFTLFSQKKRKQTNPDLANDAVWWIGEGNWICAKRETSQKGAKAKTRKANWDIVNLHILSWRMPDNGSISLECTKGKESDQN